MGSLGHSPGLLELAMDRSMDSKCCTAAVVSDAPMLVVFREGCPVLNAACLHETEASAGTNGVSVITTVDRSGALCEDVKRGKFTLYYVAVATESGYQRPRRTTLVYLVLF